MILLDDVVEILHLADVDRGAVRLMVALEGRFMGRTPVDADLLRHAVTSVYVCVDMLSLTPLLRYDGCVDHALPPIPDARAAHALQRHTGDRAVMAGALGAEPRQQPGVTHASGAGTQADLNSAPRADVTRRRGSNRDQEGFPFTEWWEGSRDWKPDMPRGSYRLDRLIIDRLGQSEVRCERAGQEYRGREYRCEGSCPMDFTDVEQRWQQYVNEFFAEQGMPEDFFYEARGDGEEPQLVLDTEHARVYAAWLATKGHITEVEHQWLARDIQQREEDRRDEVAE